VNLREIEAAARTLRDASLRRLAGIGSVGPALGALSAAAIWRDIEPTPGGIGFDGVTFLRGGWPKCEACGLGT